MIIKRQMIYTLTLSESDYKYIKNLLDIIVDGKVKEDEMKSPFIRKICGEISERF